MADRLGKDACIGIGAQSAWVTAVARSVWFPLVSTTLQRTVKRVPRETLAHSTSFNARSHYVSEDRAGGTVETLVQYEGFGMLLAHILGGTPATTGPSGGLYTHVYTLGATLPAGLSVELQRGTGTSELFVGARVSKATLKLDTGKEMKCSLDLVCRTSDARTTAVTPTWTASRDGVVGHHHAGTLLWNSVAYTIDSLEVVIDNKINPRQSLGSALAAELPRNGMMEITIKADMIIDSDAFHDALTAGTTSDVVITFSSVDAAGTTFTIAGNKAYIAEPKDPISSAGPIKTSVTFVCQADNTDEGIKFTLVNTQATAQVA